MAGLSPTIPGKGASRGSGGGPFAGMSVKNPKSVFETRFSDLNQFRFPVMSMIAKPADSLLENSKLDPQMAPRFPHFRFGISDLYQLFRGSQGSRQFLAATREQSGQAVRRKARIVQEHAAHLIEHEARQILAGPTLFQEPTADGLQQLIAQLSRLSRNGPLVKSQH